MPVLSNSAMATAIWQPWKTWGSVHCRPGRYGKESRAGQYRRTQGQVGMGGGGVARHCCQMAEFRAAGPKNGPVKQCSGSESSSKWCEAAYTGWFLGLSVCGRIFFPAAEFFWLNWPRSPGGIWQQCCTYRTGTTQARHPPPPPPGRGGGVAGKPEFTSQYNK